MPYITSIERMARKEGLEQGLEQGLERGLERGLEQGLEQGREEGLKKGIVDNLTKVLAHRFGPLSQGELEQIHRAGCDQLQAWFDQALTIEDRAALFREP